MKDSRCGSSKADAGDYQTASGAARPDLLCFSHLRWDFVFQRPQHLLSRAARTMRVLFWEEPMHTTADRASVDRRISPEGVIILRPRIPRGQHWAVVQRVLLAQALQRVRASHDPLLWFYTPYALTFCGRGAGGDGVRLHGRVVGLRRRRPGAAAAGARLLARASLVFTGGQSLYEAKRAAARAMSTPSPAGWTPPTSCPARGRLPDPLDQAAIPHPRIGFYGVLDERLDRALLAAVADLRPDTHFVMVGPSRSSMDELPRRPNLHYLGGKSYAELPAYVANWDVALMPFALNEATRFISPTKTPEYLAAGRPVVSTPIVDVVRQYGATDGRVHRRRPRRSSPPPPTRRWRSRAARDLAARRWTRCWQQSPGTPSGPACRRLWRRRAARRADRPRRPRRGSWPPHAHYDVLVVGAGFAGSVLAERHGGGVRQARAAGGPAPAYRRQRL